MSERYESVQRSVQECAGVCRSVQESVQESLMIAIYSRYIYTQMLIAVFSENCQVYQTQELGSIVVSLHWGILRGVDGYMS